MQPFILLFIKKHISGGRTAEATMELEAGGTLEEMGRTCIGLHALEAAAWMQWNWSCVWHLVKQTGHHRHDILQLHPIYCTEEMRRDRRQLVFWPLAHWTEQKSCWLRDGAALGPTVLGQPKLNAPAQASAFHWPVALYIMWQSTHWLVSIMWQMGNRRNHVCACNM